MTQPLLSILIPTVVGREKELQILLNKIAKQFWGFPSGMGTLFLSDKKDDEKFGYSFWGCRSSQTEFIVCEDNKEITLGEKRELLYKKANGLFSWEIDDDDLISDNAIELIIAAIEANPDVDCITFREKCLMNGNQYRSNFSLSYDDWHDNYDGYDFVRTPFYKCVIKTEIAKSVPFEHIRYGEDHAFARALKPHLKTEVHIDEELYIYQHNSKPEDFNARYGFDKQ